MSDATEPVRPEIDQSITFTYTRDLDRASLFLRDTLGLALVVEQVSCHIFRLTSTSFLGVCHLPGRPMGTDGVMLTIVSDDVDGWHQFLTAKGVEYEREPEHDPRFGIYTSGFRSPDGYRIEIQRFDDPTWAHGTNAT